MAVEVVQMSQDFDVMLYNWVKAVTDQILSQVNKRHNTEEPYITLECKWANKFVRIESIQGGQRSIWAFVALRDGESKALGKWKKGDILKAATWKAPAKHARGNIFENLPLCNIINWTGPSYIK